MQTFEKLGDLYRINCQDDFDILGYYYRGAGVFTIGWTAKGVSFEIYIMWRLIMIDSVLSGQMETLPHLLQRGLGDVDVNDAFVELTGFERKDILGKSMEAVFQQIRIGPEFDTDHVEELQEYFLFTKSLEVRFVRVKLIKGMSEQIYVIKEIPFSRLDKKMAFAMQLCNNNNDGIAVFSLPDRTLLQANASYINLVKYPYNSKERILGKRIDEFMDGFVGSLLEDTWNNLYDCRISSYVEEDTVEDLRNERTYWRRRITPILESGKPRFCVQMNTEITEQLLYKKKIEEQSNIIKSQNQQLKRQASLLDMSNEAIFFCDLDGRIVSWNKGAEMMYGYGKEEAIGSLGYKLLNSITQQPMPEIHSLILERKYWKSEILQTRKDGRKMLIETIQQLITDEDGNNVILKINHDISERKRLEGELKCQKELLEVVVDNVRDAIIVVDQEGNFVFRNKSALSKYPKEKYNNLKDKARENKYFDINNIEIPMDCLPAARVIRGEHITRKIVLEKSDEKEWYMSCSGTPVFDEDGKLRFGVVSINDLTKLIEQTKIIEQQKQELEIFIENIPQGIMLVNKNGEYCLLNKAIHKFFNIEEGIKKVGDTLTTTRYFDTKGNELFYSDFPGLKVLSGEKKHENYIFKAVRLGMSRYFSVNAQPVYHLNGSVEYAMVCVTDINEKYRHDQEIKRQNEKLQAIIETMSDALIMVYPDNSYNLINENAFGIVHTSDEWLYYRNGNDSVTYFDVHGNELTDEELPHRRVLKGERLVNEIIKVCRAQDTKYISYNGSPTYDGSGIVLYGTICIRDMTEYIRNEKAFEESRLRLYETEKQTLKEAIDMKDEFLSVISHEFRTPLNVINTVIQSMNFFCRDQMSDKAKDYIEIIRRNINRQLRLVNNLLDITRVNAGRIAIHKKNQDIVFVTKVITESVTTYAAQKNIDLTFKASLKKRIIGIDDEKYERILLNVLSNAIKFTPSGKSIHVHLYRHIKYICIDVADDGIGIPEDKLDLIFERFGQVDSSLSRQAEGTGIGLSLVKKFVTAMGGFITVSSKSGQGSTFTIMLPDEMVMEEEREIPTDYNLMDDRLVQITKVEFSDIYL